MSKSKFSFLSLVLLVFLNASCTFAVFSDKGNISFDLLDSRAVSEGEVNYKIELKTLDEKNIVQAKEVKSSNGKTTVQLTNIRKGEYKLVINGQDKRFKYYAKTDVQVVPGPIPTEVTITLHKEKIEEGGGEEIVPPPVERKLTGIEVALKDSSSYVLYGDTLDIKKFSITEKYSDGQTVVVPEHLYDNYTITPTGNITNVGSTEVTIEYKRDANIKGKSKIDCKHDLPNVTISFANGNNVTVEQGKELILEATITRTTQTTLPESFFTTKYEWLTKNSDGSGYTKISGEVNKTYTVPTSDVGNKTYKCKVTLEPTNPSLCVPMSKSNSSDDVTINVTSQSGGGGSSSGVTTFTALKDEIGKMYDGGTVIIGGDIVMDETISISKTITLKATQNVTLTRGVNNKGDMFSLVTGKSCNLKLGDPNNSNFTITLDGNKSKVSNITGSLISVPEGDRLTMNNVILQNNNRSNGGGGAIYSDHGQLEINNSKIINNDASSWGGGVYVITGKAAMTNVTFENNTSSSNGGAMAFTANCSEVSLNNTDTSYYVSNNKANLKGGGAFVSGGSFKILAGSINNNTTGTNGGYGSNVYLQKNATSGNVSLNGKTITRDCALDGEVNSTTKPQ